MKHKFNILVVAINTRDSEREPLDEAVHYIQKQHEVAKHRDIIEVKPLFATTVNDIRGALLDDDNPVSMLIFMGKGTETGQFAFASETNTQHCVTPEALAGLISIFPSVKCVLMLADYGKKQLEAMHNAGIEFVAGTNEIISAKSIYEYAGAFVQAIAAGETLERAKRLAENAPMFANENTKFTALCCNQDIEQKPNYLQYIISQLKNEAKSATPELITETHADRACSAWDHTTLLKDLKQHTNSNLIILPCNHINHHPEAATLHIAHNLGNDWTAVNVKSSVGLQDSHELHKSLKEAIGATRTGSFEDMSQNAIQKKVIVGQKICLEQMNLAEAKQLIQEYLNRLGKWQDTNKKFILYLVGIPSDVKEKKRWWYFGKVITRTKQWNEMLKKLLRNPALHHCTLFKPLHKVTLVDIKRFLSYYDISTDKYDNVGNDYFYFETEMKKLKSLYIEKMNEKYKRAV